MTHPTADAPHISFAVGGRLMGGFLARKVLSPWLMALASIWTNRCPAGGAAGVGISRASRLLSGRTQTAFMAISLRPNVNASGIARVVAALLTLHKYGHFC